MPETALPILGASTACLAQRDLASALGTLRWLGFDAVELLAFERARHSQGELPGAWLDGLDEDGADRLHALLAEFGTVTVHAPFIDLPLFTHNPELAREARRQLEATIIATGRLCGSVVAVHAHPKTGYTLDEAWPEMIDTFRRLGDVAADCDVVVGLETMYPPTLETYVGLISAIDHPAVGSTLDVGHVAWTVPQSLRGTEAGIAQYNNTLNDLVDALGARLFSLHLHDVNADAWRDHRTPGTGCLDWRRLTDHLRQTGCSAPALLELEEPDAEAALAAARDLLVPLLAEASPTPGG